MSRGVRKHDHAARRREAEARQAQVAARFGIAWDDIPPAIAQTLYYGEPEHPRKNGARRRRVRGYSFGRPNVLGWRDRLHMFEYLREKYRQAEIAVRRLLTKRTGRGKPLHRKAHVHARERIDAREWRDGL